MPQLTIISDLCSGEKHARRTIRSFGSSRRRGDWQLLGGGAGEVLAFGPFSVLCLFYVCLFLVLSLFLSFSLSLYFSLSLRLSLSFFVTFGRFSSVICLIICVCLFLPFLLSLTLFVGLSGSPSLPLLFCVCSLIQSFLFYSSSFL